MSNIEKDLTPTIEDEDTFSIDGNEEMLIMEAALLMGGNGNTDVGRMNPRQNKRQSAVVAPRRSIIIMPRNKNCNNLRRRSCSGLLHQPLIPRDESPTNSTTHKNDKQDRATNRLSFHVSDEDLLMQTARLMQQRQNRRDSESIPRRRASVQRLAEKAKRKTSYIAEGQESLLTNQKNVTNSTQDTKSQKNVTNSTQDTKRTPIRPSIKRKTSDIVEDQNSNEDTNRTARRSSVTTRVTSNDISQTRADEELNHQTPVLQQPKNCNASNHFHVPSFGWLGKRGGTFRDIASMSLVFLACLMAVTQVKTHIATSEIRTVKVSLII